MIAIEIGSPQPLDCIRCKSKYGYKVTQRIQKYCDLMYDVDGDNDGCIYSDSEKIIRTLIRPSCNNCNTVLPFKIKN